MQVGYVSSSVSKKCVICGKSTATYKVYEQTGISLKIPACAGEHYRQIDVADIAAVSISFIKKIAMRG